MKKTVKRLAASALAFTLLLPNVASAGACAENNKLRHVYVFGNDAYAVEDVLSDENIQLDVKRKFNAELKKDPAKIYYVYPNVAKDLYGKIVDQTGERVKLHKADGIVNAFPLNGSDLKGNAFTMPKAGTVEVKAVYGEAAKATVKNIGDTDVKIIGVGKDKINEITLAKGNVANEYVLNGKVYGFKAGDVIVVKGDCTTCPLKGIELTNNCKDSNFGVGCNELTSQTGLCGPCATVTECVDCSAKVTLVGCQNDIKAIYEACEDTVSWERVAGVQGLNTYKLKLTGSYATNGATFNYVDPKGDDLGTDPVDQVIGVLPTDAYYTVTLYDANGKVLYNGQVSF